MASASFFLDRKNRADLSRQTDPDAILEGRNGLMMKLNMLREQQRAAAA